MVEWSILLACGEAAYSGGNMWGSSTAHLFTRKQKTTKDQDPLQRYTFHSLRPFHLTYLLILLLPINFNTMGTKFLTLGPLGSICYLSCSRLHPVKEKRRLKPVFAHMERVAYFPYPHFALTAFLIISPIITIFVMCVSFTYWTISFRMS